MGMLRHVILIQLKPDVTDRRVEALVAEAETVRTGSRGMLSLTIGRDPGLREGDMSLAAVTDFKDEGAWRELEADEEHNRLRREVLAPLAERAERCQFRL
jgi:hypothetical protein